MRLIIVCLMSLAVALAAPVGSASSNPFEKLMKQAQKSAKNADKPKGSKENAQAPAQPEVAESATPFRILCEEDGYVFGDACTGRFEGQLGIWVMQLPRAKWDPSNDGALLAYSIRNIGNFDTGRGWSAQVAWGDFKCRVVSSDLVSYDYLTEFRGNQCEGYRFSKENFTVTDVHIAVMPDAAWIAKLEGVYVGHPDNSVTSGSFRDALEARFQGTPCERNNGAIFCREKPIKQQYGFTLKSPEITRILVSQSGPGRFAVTIENKGAVGIAREFMAYRIEKDRDEAPVKDF